ALALATTGNRRISEAERGVDAAAARVRDTRGLLLPATTGSGRYTWYTSELRNAIALPSGVLPGVTNPNFVIREQQSGRLNGSTPVPLDVTGQIWKTLTASQAGYRGERARLGDQPRAEGRRDPRLLRRPRGAAPAGGRAAGHRGRQDPARQRPGALRQRTPHQERAARRAGEAPGRRAGAAAARARHRPRPLDPQRGHRPARGRADHAGGRRRS